jgi:putative PIN family toxin of toxin-antitoxin system
MPRYVFDSNVIVSALIINRRCSPPKRALLLALSRGILLMSTAQAEELEDVFSRSKFDRYATTEERRRLLQGLLRETELVEITEPVRASSDPKDDKILELAVNGDADYIVSGDRPGLLDLNPFRDIEIIRPAEFLAIASAQ